MVDNIYDSEPFFNAYAEMDRSKYGLPMAGEWHQLEPLFPDLVGKDVLDLGCGYGWHCKYAAEHGAGSVLGIDCSEMMLSVARGKNADPKIRYEQVSIEDYSYPKKRYDLVLSNLALHYIEDLESIFQKVYWTLKENGVFLFNIEHPTFTAGVDQSWILGEDGRPQIGRASCRERV